MESGSGEYRTYTPPPMLDEVATATGVDSSPEGVVLSQIVMPSWSYRTSCSPSVLFRTSCNKCIHVASCTVSGRPAMHYIECRHVLIT